MKKVFVMLLSVLIIMLCGCNDGIKGPNSDISPNSNMSEDDNKYQENTSLTLTYPIVDTGITDSYSDVAVITKPKQDDLFYGQDSNYTGNE
ncbi:MAG: hypothetical protein WCR27_05165, partial [Eubacteriales bacterium]